MSWDKVPSAPMPSDPAAGADLSYTIPTGTRVYLMWIVATLVTDANVANRTMHIAVTNAADVEMFRFPFAADTANQTASGNCRYTFAVDQTASDGADQAQRGFPIAQGLEIPATWKIKTVTTNKQVGDQWAIAWGLKRRPA